MKWKTLLFALLLCGLFSAAMAQNVTNFIQNETVPVPKSSAYVLVAPADTTVTIGESVNYVFTVTAPPAGKMYDLIVDGAVGDWSKQSIISAHDRIFTFKFAPKQPGDYSFSVSLIKDGELIDKQVAHVTVLESFNATEIESNINSLRKMRDEYRKEFAGKEEDGAYADAQARMAALNATLEAAESHFEKGEYKAALNSTNEAMHLVGNLDKATSKLTPKQADILQRNTLILIGVVVLVIIGLAKFFLFGEK